MSKPTSVAIGILLGLALAAAAQGKAATALVSVSGPGIDGEIATKSPDAIAGNAWTGSFAVADAGVAAPDAGLPRHLVRFYIDRGAEGLHLVYAVEFVWDAAAGQALVHLPGPGEPWFRLNVGTILHDGSDGSALRDGRWYRAEENWTRAIRALLPGG